MKPYPILANRSTDLKALIALAVISFFWGTAWVVSREGVRHMPALQMAGVRQLISGTIFVVFFLAKGERFPRGKEWVPVLILSILNFTLSNGLATWGVKYISAGLGSILGAIFPLWLAIIGFFVAKERLPLKGVMGILLGFAGICVIFYEHLGDFINPQFRFGIIISFIATWTWTFGTLYTKKQAPAFNPYFSVGLQMVIASAVLLIYSYSAHDVIALTAVPWQSWAVIIYLAVFCSVFSFVAYLYALQHLPTGLVSLYAYINPVVAISLGWLLFDELLTPYIVAGVLITLGGVYLVNKSLQKITG